MTNSKGIDDDRMFRLPLITLAPPCPLRLYVYDEHIAKRFIIPAVGTDLKRYGGVLGLQQCLSNESLEFFVFFKFCFSNYLSIWI